MVQDGSGGGRLGCVDSWVVGTPMKAVRIRDKQRLRVASVLVCMFRSYVFSLSKDNRRLVGFWGSTICKQSDTHGRLDVDKTTNPEPSLRRERAAV